MIFVTVGTHEQPFNRLLERIDQIKKDYLGDEEVIIQTGFSTFHPEHCKTYKFIPFDQMQKLVDRARIVITHGGPSSFMMALQAGKVPIVVPRRASYHEHVNDHQVVFCNEVEQRLHNIISVNEMDSLQSVIKNYTQLIENKEVSQLHNKIFVNDFKAILDDLTKK